MGITPQLLNDMLILTTLVVGGSAAVAGFLWLAGFSKNERTEVARSKWLTGGVICVFFYFVLAWQFSLSSPIVLLLLILMVGPPLFLTIGPHHEKFHRWIFYVVWIYFWIAALIGWRAGWMGVLLITLPALLVTGVGLFIMAGFLLPFPKPKLQRGNHPPRSTEGIVIPTFKEELVDFWLLRHPENRDALKQRFEQQRQALHSLISYTLGTNYAYYVVIDEKINRRTEGDRTWLTEEEKLIKRIGGDPFREFMAGPGIILTGCDHAVVISTGIAFKGTRGPGVIFIGMSETPMQVIDLRVQLRAFLVKARTKDGIDVEVVTFTPFQIGTRKDKKEPPKTPKLGEGFPYLHSDVFEAIRAQQVVHSRDTYQEVPESLQKHAWYDLPRLAGQRIMREIISHYEFDDLYAPFDLHQDPSQDPRAMIGAGLAKELEQVLPEWGIQRIGSGISNLMPADERVLERRIGAWQADWTRQIMLRQAAGQSRRLHLVEQARAQAQIDIILVISERMEQLRSAGVDAVARHFIEILERLIEKSTLGPFLPYDTGAVIRRARGMLGAEPAGPAEG